MKLFSFQEGIFWIFCQQTKSSLKNLSKHFTPYLNQETRYSSQFQVPGMILEVLILQVSGNL